MNAPSAIRFCAFIIDTAILLTCVPLMVIYAKSAPIFYRTGSLKILSAIMAWLGVVEGLIRQYCLAGSQILPLWRGV